MFESLLANFGPNSAYISELFELYKANPKLVGAEWASYFDKLSQTEKASTAQSNVAQIENKSAPIDFDLQARVFDLITSYRQRGHLLANINPLSQGVQNPTASSDLELENYAFSDEDLEREVYCDGFLGYQSLKLKDLIAQLQETYCSTIGFEYSHIENFEERKWIESKVEQRDYSTSTAEKTERLKSLIHAESLEQELFKKYIGAKWFSLYGGDSLIPMLQGMLRSAPRLGVREVLFGMAHRGRLNVLHNIMSKPLSDIFCEFEDRTKASVHGQGDTKYHMGYESIFSSDAGDLRLSLAPNPSHLEFINPVVEGMARARQDQDYLLNRNFVLPVLIHGDAAVIGQGVVSETMNFSGVRGFDTSGTLHIVINNQIGFTATPDEVRTSTYCTAFAQAIGALILHVNCEDLDAACWAINFALEYRQKFEKDVFIDLYSYRRYGHNEGDDPTFTSPVTYAEIAKKTQASKLYLQSLAGSIDQDFYQKTVDEFREYFHAQQDIAESKLQILSKKEAVFNDQPNTNVSSDVLIESSEVLVKYPQGFTVHPKLAKILERRYQTVNNASGIDWGTAEILAYASLMQDGYSIRLTGQDVGRGTFSHRNVVLTDYQNGQDYCILDRLNLPVKAEIYNSVLSEAAVLGFEFGYSTQREKALVIWEAQFGDFANGAQVIIDQFISSCEAKWEQETNLAILLPHGYEGGGAEHSSARLERFLQLCADNNIQVCHPSNAGQIFHLLRRQALSKTKKPLVVMSPKSLLRFPEAAVDRNILEHGKFQDLIIEDFAVKKNPKLIMLSGKVYYDVKKSLANNENYRICRVEQLYPLAINEIQKFIGSAKEVIWVQEEPKNMGAWSYMLEALYDLDVKLSYVGRKASATPATGSSKYHQIELQNLLADLQKLL